MNKLSVNKLSVNIYKKMKEPETVRAVEEFPSEMLERFEMLRFPITDTVFKMTIEAELFTETDAVMFVGFERVIFPKIQNNKREI